MKKQLFVMELLTKDGWSDLDLIDLIDFNMGETLGIERLDIKEVLTVKETDYECSE
ncbi:MAG: hypothetical protein JSW60_03710 [Thermoplasmatales archaeon]|nr:MAG: hypothetical protein JSW60_03710 [Thermoplasmatales archaeon]